MSDTYPSPSYVPFYRKWRRGHGRSSKRQLSRARRSQAKATLAGRRHRDISHLESWVGKKGW